MIKAIILFLRECNEFFRYFILTGRDWKTIAFYSEHEGYYPYFEGLMNELTKSRSQNVCYVTSDPDDLIFQSTNNRIKVFYLRKLLPFFALFVKFRVFVMTLTELNLLEFRRSVNQVHYVYVFHSPVSTHMAYQRMAFDHYDSILCIGPYHVEEIRAHEKLNGLKPKILVKAGYYRLERVYNAYKTFTQTGPVSGRRQTVLIAPSWGDENILESCGKRLVEILLNENLEIIVRPHPETIRRSPDLIEMLRNHFGPNPDFHIELSVATDDALLRSDVLITDYSGIAVEYAFGTERPVLFLDVPAKIRNRRYAEIGTEPFELAVRSQIGLVVSPHQLDTIVQAINDLIREKESYRAQIIELRKRSIYSFGNSSGIGAQFITDLLSGMDVVKCYNTDTVVPGKDVT
jgi:YidC/Oxa1 family membrane protein insertase